MSNTKKFVLQASTIRPGTETRHFQYYTLITSKHSSQEPKAVISTSEHNPARNRNEAFPVLKCYYKQAHSSQEPKRGISGTKSKHNPARNRNEAFPVLKLYYKIDNPAKSRKESVPVLKLYYK